MGKTILQQIKEVDYAFSLCGENYEGHCPCAEFKLTDDKGTVHALSRCWRVSDSIGDGKQDLYVWGDHPDLKSIAKALKKSLDKTEWYNPYKIIYEAPAGEEDE